MNRKQKNLILAGAVFLLAGCGAQESMPDIPEPQPVSGNTVTEERQEYSGSENAVISEMTVEEVFLKDTMEFAENSVIHTDPALLYHNNDTEKGNIVVCVNAGHGTNGGTQVKTLCHPDGTLKVTAGSTAEGSLTATAVSSGMEFPDGTAEKEVTLEQAVILRDLLLDSGYSVLMIREGEDVQLDNVARTLLANAYADCHIALHWDSSEKDKGAFYCSVPEVESYRNMYPVSDTWEQSHALGDSIMEGLKDRGIKIYGDGFIPLDLTQTSYSTIPSIDLELGDKLSDRSTEQLYRNAVGIVSGIDLFFGKETGDYEAYIKETVEEIPAEKEEVSFSGEYLALTEQFTALRKEGYEIYEAVPLTSLSMKTEPLSESETVEEIPFGTYLAFDGILEAEENVTFLHLTDIDTGFEGYVKSDLVVPVDYVADTQSASDVVDVTDDRYTYDVMIEDIRLLCQAHSDILVRQSAGKSLCGRDIPLLILGNPDAEHKFLITAGIHGREYMTSQLVMKMIEYYADHYDTGSYGGIGYRQFLENCAFYIMPMTNPDGVSVSQYGEAGVTDEYAAVLRAAYASEKQNFIYIKYSSEETAWYDNYRGNIAESSKLNEEDISYEEYLRLWKANAAGVDINRNFDIGWDADWGKAVPALGSYRGASPESEPETKAIRQVAESEDFECTINYHAKGQVIYFDSYGMEKENANVCKKWAQLVSNICRYDLSAAAKPTELSEYGSFGELVHLSYDKPGFTIEIGRYTCPLDSSEFPAVFERNRETWAAVCREALQTK